jgi:adenine-specific DNA-methyltransferase
MSIDKLSPKTPDLTKQNARRLAELFPECVTEGPEGTASDRDEPVIDFDLLRQALAAHLVEGPQERYRLDWPGKREALLAANSPIDRTLRAVREESVGFDATRNLFIEGDNLDALKLLQETYLGRVKMIYIDPPYNTGKDFIYKDNFTQSRESYEAGSGQRDDAGGRLVANPETNGRFHSDWLSMIYPRLKIARDLLREDGFLFVTIDDVEYANLSKILAELFGEDNVIATIIWQKKYAVSNDDPNIGIMHDYIICVRRSESSQRNLLPRTETQLKRYTNPDNHPLGRWASDNYVSNKSKTERPTLYYSIKHPKTGEDVWPDEDAVWRYNREQHERMVAEDRLYWGPDQSYKKPRLKRFLSEIQDGLVPSTWWPHDEVGHNDEAQKETGALLGKKVFDTPKPIRLLDRILAIAVAHDDIVLDFFAGSGALGQAVMAFNSKHASAVRYILVQLAEGIDEDSYAFQQGYRSISQITKERLRKAGAGLAAQSPENRALDVGFRAFRIDTGNFHDVRTSPSETSQATLAGLISHIKDDRSDEDLLFGALLRWGVDITLPVRSSTLLGRTIWLVDPPMEGNAGAAVAACFARPSGGQGGVDVELADALAAMKPLRVLFRDDGFATDAAKENVASRIRQRSPDTEVRVL